MGTFTDYIAEAMRRAKYSLLEDKDTPYLGEIPGLRGVFAVSNTLKGCREELQSVLEDWILLGLRMEHKIPSLGKHKIPSGKPKVKKVA